MKPVKGLHGRNGGNTVTDGRARTPSTFWPDYGIEYYRARIEITPLGWVVLALCIALAVCLSIIFFTIWRTS